VIARARIVAEVAGDGRTHLAHLRSAAPLLLRCTPDAVYLVAGAAGPLGGDDLRLDIEVGAGAELTVRSAAASLALPGPGGRGSHLTLTARIEEGGSLNWLPEPLIACEGCNHRTETRIDLAAGASLVWREELILGRHGESPGDLTARMDCEIAGRVALRNELRVGPGAPGWDGPAMIGDYRAVATVLVTNPAIQQAPSSAQFLSESAAALPLEGGAILITALAPDGLALRTKVEEALASLG
jgi:urease accessory protein